ncbi:MAG: caspase family protein [Pseudomonadota bacterium]
MIAALLLCAASLAGPRGVVTDLPAPPALAQAFAPRRVALLVGVDDYDDPTLGSLRFAAKDAEDLRAVLADPALGGFSVRALTTRVTREELWAAFTDVTAELQPDDTFLLYLAGHGTLEMVPAAAGQTVATEPRLYLMTTDSRLGAPASTGVSLAELDAAVSALPAHRRVVVVDACYSGKGRSALSPAAAQARANLRGPIASPDLPASRYDVRLFAADVNHPALEAPELQNGIYSHFLVQGLEGEADLDGDGLVDVRELRLWARDRTMAYTGGAQVPWSHETQVGWGEIFLSGDPRARHQAEHAILVGLEALPEQAEVSVDGQPRGAGSLPPGEHELTILLDGVPIGVWTVTLGPGERLDVSSIVGQGVPPENLTSVGLNPALYAPPERAGRLLIGLTGSALAGQDLAPSFAAGVSVWAELEHAGPRLALGVAAEYGLGPVWDLEALFPVGSARLRGGWWWGERWVVGPTLDAGMLARSLPAGLQAGLLLAPGAHLHRSLGALDLGLEADLPLVWTRGGMRALPGARLTLGTHLGGHDHAD